MAREQRAGAEVHPDADILTAFCEGVLNDSERGRVMDHISRCGECREVVFLAAPELPQPVAAPVVSGWRRLMPVMAAVAAVVVVGSAVLLDRSHTEQGAKNTEVELKNEPPAVPPAASPEPRKSSSSRETTAAARDKTESSPLLLRKDGAPGNDVAAAKGGVVGGTLGEIEQAQQSELSGTLQNRMAAPGSHGAVEPKGSASNYQRVPVTPPRAVAVPSATGGSLSANGSAGKLGYAASSARSDQSGIIFERPASPPPVQQQEAKSKVIAPNGISEVPASGRNFSDLAANQPGVPNAQSKPVAAARADAAGGARADAGDQLRAMDTNVEGASLQRESAAVRAHWRINNSGGLERSIGDGKWQAMLRDAATKFRVVSAMGNEVWAGGAAGALYHSLDAGESWSKQPLPGPTDAIISIQFRDAKAGTLKTEGGAVWETSDGGAHWTRK